MATPKRAIVIGTGAGGLAAAAYLAKAGLDVTALEQAEHFGGYLAPFRRDGYEFDPGLHYIGECREGEPVHRLLSGLGIDATSLFCELDPEGFDVFRFPESEIRRCRGEDAFQERLTAAFPAEVRGIARIFDRARAFRTAYYGLGQLKAEGLRGLRFGVVRNLPTLIRSRSQTFGELLDSTLSDPRVRAILAAPCGDYGLPPSRAWVGMGLLCLTHYMNGAFFPRGGSGALCNALVQAAERSGARFRTRARVEKILMRDGRAAGVQLEGGEQIDADIIVSDVDPVVTLGRLLDASELPADMVRKVRLTEPSIATFSVFLGLRRDLAKHGMGRFNVWDYASWDLDEAYVPVFRGELPKKPAIFLSPNSMKDDSHALAPPGCSTLEVITFVPYSMFARWADRPVGQRGDDYEAEKKRVTDWLLDEVEQRWPGLVGDVAVQVVSSPLTNESYVGAVRGGAYGPAMTPEQSGWQRFGTTTPLPNLFLAGAGAFGDGVGACLESGRIAAAQAARVSVSERHAPLLPRLRHKPA